MTKKATIWHYPRCSKSRKTLALLEEKDLALIIRHYRDDPPDLADLREAIEKLEISPAELVRKKDKAYKELEISAGEMTDDDWLDLLAKNPALIERPVVLTEEGAVIGRPPENIENLF